jgi:hypothetical protein
MQATRLSQPFWQTRQFEVIKRGRFRPQGPARIEESHGRVSVTPEHAHAGEHFTDAEDPAFRAGSRAPSILTAHLPKIRDFTPLPSSSALASCFFRSLVPAVPPLLSPELNSKARCHHVELDALQCYPLDVVPPRRSQAAPSTHPRCGVEGARGGVHVVPAQGVCPVVHGLPRVRLLHPRWAFIRAVLFEYGLQLQHLNPNSIQ